MDLPAKLTENLSYMLHRMALEYEQYFDNQMQALGLTRSQWILLSHLYFCDDINQKTLADIMGIGKGAIGRLAQKLESKGWIERLPDANDGRAFNLRIRPNAKPMVKKLVDLLILETEHSLGDFQENEVETIRRQLRRISANLQNTPLSPRWLALKKQLLADVRKLGL